ncbi:MAG: hypothetical protein KA327_06780 [Pseudarcicella sp.]|nr:hypothetical protein [Pseudarcicella sp.]
MMHNKVKKLIFVFCVGIQSTIYAQHTFSIAKKIQTSQVEFAIKEIENAIRSLKTKQKVAISFRLDTTLSEQSYKLSTDKKAIFIYASDPTGAMYGGLSLAENIQHSKAIPNTINPEIATPFIKKRGLKFNIPLDIRTPSYQDAGDAAQKNILEMWNFDFWKQYFDMMARNRYNVLTLWNPNPFPSMVKMKNYPDINLDNVCGTSFPLDTDREDEPTAKFIAGCGVSDSVMNNLIVLKKISIDDKIAFWQKVMRYAKDRGVAIHFITWNIWMNSIAPTGWYREQQNKKGTAGKYGINNDQDNPKTIAYLREAVKEFVLTYPDLAGIGVTAGENMEDRTDEFDREKWLWATYGEGIADAKKIRPTRKIEFIHRHWQTAINKIKSDFVSKYPDEINMSFKYARARMYATTSPRWADEYIKELKQEGLKSWWNIRNDDIFHFRWGDPEYASLFMKNIPPKDITAGYFMGSDSYVWGREFISKHPTQPRQLEIDKHWYNFMLWGRLGYNPDTPQSTFENMLGERYPGVSPQPLYQAWATASKITSLATRFHWHDWDFMWAVEGCLDLRKGFHTIEDFIAKPPMAGSEILSIPITVKSILNKTAFTGTTPLQVANSLDSLANVTLVYTQKQHLLEKKHTNEFNELLYDLDAFSYLGKYYSNKISAAFYFHAFQQLKQDIYKQKTIASLQKAVEEWKLYAKAATRNYKPQFLSKTRTIDWDKLTSEVENELINVEKLVNK